MYPFLIATVLTIACTTKPDPVSGTSHPVAGLTEGPPADTPEVDPPNEQGEDTGETTPPPPLINMLSLSVETLPDCVVCATVQVSLDVAAPVTLRLGERGSGSVPWVQSESSEHHTIPLLELHADTPYELEVRIDGPGGSIAGHTVFTTEPLPDIFPPITLEVGGDIRQQPGLTLVTILEWSSSSARRFLVAALDNDGEVVWYHQLDHLVLALGLDEQMRIYTTDSTQKAVRIDPYGQTKTVWSVEDLGIPAVHHEIRPIEGGGMALLTTELQNIDGWWMPPMVYPTSFNVVGDIFAVFDAEGHQTWSWSMLDHFDPLEYHTSDMHMNFWDMPPYVDVDDPKDWSHANTLIPRGGNWVASLRNLDWVMEINPDTDEVEWIFGHNGDFTLTDGGRWFSRQHRPSFPSDNTILMYDNGLDRADAEEDEEAFSRIVEYQLDTETMTATELWSWSGGDRYVSPIAGGVSRLENDNHLINDGAIYHGSYFAEDRLWPHYSARIREVVGTEDPEVIWEVNIGYPDDLEKTGWFVYRAERIDSLYPVHARPE